MTFDYLVTTINKTESEIIRIVSKMNVNGNVFVGNQNSKVYSEKIIALDKIVINLFNLVGKGVSKNRNFLLSKSTADYVMFLDDDVSFLKNAQEKMEATVEQSGKKFHGYRFNSSSKNDDRPIKQINKNGEIKIFNLKNFGVWGVYFDRRALVESKLLFDELVGPGSIINHGEDFLFLRNFTFNHKIYQFSFCGFLIEQQDSTWTGKNRDIVRELFSHGYVYKKTFNNLWWLYLLIHFIKHGKNYQLKNKNRFKICFAGARYCRYLSKIESANVEEIYHKLVDEFYE